MLEEDSCVFYSVTSSSYPVTTSNYVHVLTTNSGSNIQKLEHQMRELSSSLMTLKESLADHFMQLKSDLVEIYSSQIQVHSCSCAGSLNQSYCYSS
jgi:uncharacterized membrane-anchored protein YhcB (DUF1043 family)